MSTINTVWVLDKGNTDSSCDGDDCNMLTQLLYHVSSHMCFTVIKPGMPMGSHNKRKYDFW